MSAGTRQAGESPLAGLLAALPKAVRNALAPFAGDLNRLAAFASGHGLEDSAGERAAETPAPIGADTDERISIAIEASYEVEALARALIELHGVNGVSAMDYAVRGIAMRLRDLASVQMSALDDEVEPASSIRGRLEGNDCGDMRDKP